MAFKRLVRLLCFDLAALSWVSLCWSSGSPPDFADLARKAAPAVVSIGVEQASTTAVPQDKGRPEDDEVARLLRRMFQVPLPPRGAAAGGAGVIVSGEGQVITSSSLVAAAQHFQLTLEDGRRYRATLQRTDAETGLALLQIEDPSGLRAVPLGDSSRLRAGEWVLAVGRPFGEELGVSAGVVAAIASQDGMILVDKPMSSGMAGGVLLNLRGEAVGIIVTGAACDRGLGCAVPTNRARAALLRRIVERGAGDGMAGNRQSRPALRAEEVEERLGGTLGRTTQERADRLGVKPPLEGVLILEIVARGVFATAHLQPGDLLLELDGVPVESPEQFRALVASSATGTAFRLLVRRGERLFFVTLSIP